MCIRDRAEEVAPAQSGTASSAEPAKRFILCPKMCIRDRNESVYLQRLWRGYRLDQNTRREVYAV